MTNAELKAAMQADLDLNQVPTAGRGFILKDGTFFRIRAVSTKNHSDVLKSHGLELHTFYYLHDGIRKLAQKNYSARFDSPSVRSRIASDIQLGVWLPTDKFFVSLIGAEQRAIEHSFTYQDFVNNGFQLPNPSRQLTFYVD